jgi:hypothetical protein
VGGRRAEEREQAVAGQLRDRPAEALYLLAHEADDLVEKELGPFRTDPFGNRRRGRDVGDEHGNNPPLSGGHGHVRVIAPCTAL